MLFKTEEEGKMKDEEENKGKFKDPDKEMKKMGADLTKRWRRRLPY
jgi:hypothetical protein